MARGYVDPGELLGWNVADAAYVTTWNITAGDLNAWPCVVDGAGKNLLTGEQLLAHE